MYKDEHQQRQDETRVGPSNPAADPIVQRGRDAWSRLGQGQSWQDWLAVGEALRVGRHLAMLEAHTNEPTGPRYQTVFGEWLETEGFSEIDKGDRKRLFDCLKHREEIESWRATLPLNKRLELNHPSTVWRNWQKSTVTGNATVTPRTSPVAKFKQEVARLEDENHRLRRAGDDLFVAQDTATDIARLLADRLVRITPTKARQILELLPKLYAERSAETPHDKARPRKKRRTIEDFRRDVAARKAAEAVS